ncbi:rhomboid family intramembrane serine protease [Pedobacter sp. SYP-B3415]|uniref:rhomboid family intramembrane serine protease n=1 Tax=Pedobacter sp. SYP-B3415 TaxID=2496641 RepID=UPI00101CCB2A|nr:rhomboid family intramembrane serine protease [Pedobacter sp. SYP-B3415]
MNVKWGYSPKTEKYVPLGDFSPERYLLVAKMAAENLGWKISYLSSSGLIAYTGLSWQSYSEEISVRIYGNFAVIKSECIGVQMLFNDYGKNEANLRRFFEDFEYAEFHLCADWDEHIRQFREHASTQDPDYFEQAPLRVKNRIKNVLQLFVPQRGYVVTPVLIILNTLCFGVSFLLLLYRLQQDPNMHLFPEKIKWFYLQLGANNRELVLAGQVWRLVTYQFLHVGIWHLFLNMFALSYTGLMAENKMGSIRFLIIFLLSGICGGMVSVADHEHIFMLGASGSIMGMFGAFLALILNKAFEKHANQALLISTAIVCAFMLLNGLRSHQVDNAAHFGGFISGFIFSYLLDERARLTGAMKLGLRYTLVAFLAISFIALMYVKVPKYDTAEFRKLSIVFTENIRSFNRLYRPAADMDRAERLRLIRENGIEAWQKNTRIVAEMNRLTLNKTTAVTCRLFTAITPRALRASELLYKEAASESAAYRGEINRLFQEINQLRYDAGTELGKIQD